MACMTVIKTSEKLKDINKLQTTIWRFFLCSFLLILLIKQDRCATKKIVKTLMEFFHKNKFLTENTINYDVTFGFMLSTVRGGGRNFKKAYECADVIYEWSLWWTSLIPRHGRRTQSPKLGKLSGAHLSGAARLCGTFFRPIWCPKPDLWKLITVSS